MQHDVILTKALKVRLVVKGLSVWLDALLLSERGRRRERMERNRRKISIPFTALQGWFYCGFTIFLSLMLTRLVVS